MSLSEKQLTEIESVYKIWLVENTNLDSKLEYIYKGLIDIDFTSVINAFTKRLEKVPYEFTKSEKISGSVCFFGSIFTSLLNTGKIEEIEGLFTFALCYMLIDHFLDDIKNSDIEKKKLMKEISDFLLYNKETLGNKLIEASKDRYLELILEKPKVKDSLIRLFESELKGAAISQNKNLSRSDYKTIAEEKGGRTSSAIAEIIGLYDTNQENLRREEKDSHYDCGVLIQLVDDIIDIKDDESLEIYTLARYDLENGGLDLYVYEAVLLIDKLDKIYNFFKIILLTGIILGIHDNPNSVSSSLSILLQKYDPFSKTTSKDTLNEWFHDKLYGYIENM